MNSSKPTLIYQAVVAGLTAMFVGSTLAAVNPGVQIPPPGPGQVPDYFGVSPNYATSPSPNFALVTITDSTGVGSGAVAAATTVDYLNPNYGISPKGMYTGNLMDVQVVNGGSGYTLSNTTVTVSGVSGDSATSVSLTPIIVGGVIVGFSEIPHATDYTDDAGNTYPAWSADSGTAQWIMPGGTDGNGPYWTGLGAGQFTQPIPGTGIRKFVNDVSLPGSTNNLGQTLSIANPNVYANPFTGSDYYEIAEVAYTQQMHSDLPPTHLRGYIQLVPQSAVGATDIKSITNIQLDASVPSGKYYVLGAPSYLGPVIVAQKNRAVRVRALNLLPTGAAGQLPFPVDHTYMGAGTQSAPAGANSGLYASDMPDNRTAIHLHGGTTPWISDGTPRQWFTPAGESVSRGVSATDVPDMWFDANGNLIPNSATFTQGSATCTTPGATNNPGVGALTFYYTNEQSARLMFYHDHAEGTTRLNVYGGMAAGYILRDPTEQAMTHGNVTNGGSNAVTYGGSATPVTYNEVLPEDEIPLVIQEKTFVPDNNNPVLTFYGPFRSQLNAQDPTWRWGTKGAGNPLGSWDGVTGGYVVAGQLDPIAGVTYGANGPGDLWVPHVYMTNQNPGDASGANPQGRWDYGSWFWPPATVIDHPQVTNPYYDASCTSANISNPVGTCEFQYIPGFPNGGQMPATTQAVNCSFSKNGRGVSVKTCSPTGAVSSGALSAMSQPSGTPEAFNDTAVVNGTVYPYINVEPKKYRLRMLSAGNDRTWNLSMWVASSKDVDSSSDGNVGATSAAATAATCTAGSVDPSKCTEVRMVPWDATQNNVSKFPSWWYSVLKGGITFDGRPGGVPDPKVRGPAMVQIGTEGGFLAEPTVIKNQPVNFEYNVKNILVTNVKEHALLLGAAERADVVVDFSQFAGSTIILYNDAPAALPAFDLRLDYFTGNFDNTDTGGTFSTVPGYGPNTRTVMQFRVASSCTSANCGTGINRAPGTSAPVDDVDANWLTNVTGEVRKAFAHSQDPIVVPQAAYNNVYGTNIADTVSSNLSAIGDTALTFQPFDSVDPVTGLATLQAAPVTLGLEPKAIQELFTMDYGRMNATLGTEIPNTSATTQTTIPLGYAEPPTELVQMTKDNPNLVIGGNIGQLGDGTQIWKITHNGVDTHPVHFHLFSVQLINRVGWDGAIYNPEPNEVGWKEVLRMNPLSDVIVALRPKTLTLPFKLGNSHHIADSTQPEGATANQPNLDPLTGNASTVVNRILNYGWEYVWHCHILGHEENDFMRSIAVAQVPEDPSTPVALANADGSNTVTWTDNSVVSNWATVQRSADSSFPVGSTVAFNVANPISNGGYNAYGECTSQAGCARTWTDTSVPADGKAYFYRVIAKSTAGAGDAFAKLPAEVKANVLPVDSTGATGVGFVGYDNVTANSAASGASNGAAKLYPAASLSGNALAYSAAVNTTSGVQSVTLTNTGTANLTINSVALGGADASQFVLTNGCGASLAANASCTIDVSFKPTTGGAKAATLTITDDSNFVANSTQVVSLSGTVLAPLASVSPGSLAFGNQVLANTSSAQTVTLSNTGAAPLTIANAVLGGANANQFTLTNGCGASLAAGSSCDLSVSFRPTTVGVKAATLTVTDNSNGVAGTTQVISLGGTGINGAVATLSGALTFNATVGTTSTAQTVTISNSGNQALSVAGIAVTAPFSRAANGAGAGWCSAAVPFNVAARGNCRINVVFTAPAAAGTSNGTVTFTDNSNAVAGSTQSADLTGNAVALAAVSAAPTIGTISNTSVALSWTAVEGASAYTIQRATNAAFTLGVTNVATGLTTLNTTATGLTGNIAYYFRVVAVNAAGAATNGAVSNAVLTKPAAPAGVRGQSGAAGGAVTGGLSWTSVAGLTYNVMWGTTAQLNANTGTVVTGVTSGTQLTLAGVAANTTVAMKVQAVNASGAGAWSANTNVIAR